MGSKFKSVRISNEQGGSTKIRLCLLGFYWWQSIHVQNAKICRAKYVAINNVKKTHYETKAYTVTNRNKEIKNGLFVTMHC